MKTSTMTINNHRFSENSHEESIMRYVRCTPRDEDALHNLRIELEEYRKSLSVWELIKLLFSK